MTRTRRWLTQAAAAGCDCACCRGWRRLVADHLDAPVRAEIDRRTAARIAELERELATTRKQLDACRRRTQGAA